MKRRHFFIGIVFIITFSAIETIAFFALRAKSSIDQVPYSLILSQLCDIRVRHSSSNFKYEPLFFSYFTLTPNYIDENGIKQHNAMGFRGGGGFPNKIVFLELFA